MKKGVEKHQVGNHGRGFCGKSIFLFILTCCYLLFELGFNARLLDVIGASVNEADIDHIEMWGRMISGCALTLGFWSLVIRADRTFRSLLMAMIFVAMACFAASYYIQDRILHTISETTSAAQKRAAASLVLITRSIHADDVVLKGIDPDLIAGSRPEARTFLALFPAMAIYTDNVERKTEREVRQLLHRQIVDELGGLEYVWDVYRESEMKIKESFNSYVDGAEVYRSALYGILDEQERAYRDYRSGLGDYTPNTLPRNSWSRVRRTVQSAGVPVPNDWDPRDAKTFYRVIEAKINREARRRYEDEMRRNIGEVFPATLSLEQFVARDVVQDKWRREISMEQNIELRVDIPSGQFERQIFTPWVESLVENEIAGILAPVSSFEKGGQNYQEGNRAIRIAFVPFVAFAFSIAGALFHIIKTGWLASKSIRASKSSQAVFCAMIFGMTCWVLLPSALTPNAVTESVLFNRLVADVAEKSSPLTARGIRYLVRFQPGFYPIADSIRLNILGGFDFGVDPGKNR